jgi:hypothetical protein
MDDPRTAHMARLLDNAENMTAYGKPLRECTREELMCLVAQLACAEQALRKQVMRDVDWWANLRAR